MLPFGEIEFQCSEAAGRIRLQRGRWRSHSSFSRLSTSAGAGFDDRDPGMIAGPCFWR